MVWGGISALGKLDIAFTSSKMNSTDYQEVLKNNLLPFKRRFRRIPLIFQQDNASIHASKATKKWLEDNRVNTLTWPACSPDLNPIENIWGIMVRRMYANNRQYRTIAELKNGILEAWNTLDAELINRTVESMTNRIFDVIQKKGRSINY